LTSPVTYYSTIKLSVTCLLYLAVLETACVEGESPVREDSLDLRLDTCVKEHTHWVQAHIRLLNSLNLMAKT